MNTLKVCICDDDSSMLPVYAASVKAAFQKYDVSCDIDCYTSTQPLKSRMKEYVYDVIFLDIDMPRQDGISFAAELRCEERPVPVIFVSAREDKMYDTFAVRPFGFVRKSTFLNDLTETVRLFLEANPDINADVIRFSTAKGEYSVNAKEIVYIESFHHMQCVHLKSQEPIEARSSLDVMEQILANKGFIRIHKSYIVNYHYITRITDTDVLLSTGDKLPLARSKKAEVKSQWLEYGAEKGFTYIEDL